MIKIIKDFFYKIRQDLAGVVRYPKVEKKEGFILDYDEYWKKRRGQDYRAFLSDWQKERADYFLKYVKENDVVIDIAGGDGQVLKYINSKVKIRGIVVDFNDLVLDQAKKEGLEVMKMDIEDAKELEKISDCDWITGFEIIEHIANPENFILNIKNKARKGMVFSVPNTGYYTHRLRMLFGKFPLQWINHPGEHLRFWTVTDMKWWVDNMGLKLVDIKIYQGVPFFKKIMPKLFGQGIIVNIRK